MTTVVFDSSSLVAALTDRGSPGRWARGQLEVNQIAGPHHVLVEVSNVLRRLGLAGRLDQTAAGLAHLDLLRLDVELYPFAPFADRVWELRADVTAYDAWYVAVAEEIGCSLATLDRKLAKADGPRCEFRLPV